MIRKVSFQPNFVHVFVVSPPRQLVQNQRHRTSQNPKHPNQQPENCSFLSKQKNTFGGSRCKRSPKSTMCTKIFPPIRRLLLHLLHPSVVWIQVETSSCRFGTPRDRSGIVPSPAATIGASLGGWDGQFRMCCWIRWMVVGEIGIVGLKCKSESAKHRKGFIRKK